MTVNDSRLNLLTADRVDSIFRDCLFKDNEDTSNHIKAEGIVHPVGLHPTRLEAHRAEVREMLLELPEEFLKSKGGGWSFLNACNDKHGKQWTGMHMIMEQLFQLGCALGLAQSQMPKDLWSVLPGGMPYYVVLDEKEKGSAV